MANSVSKYFKGTYKLESKKFRLGYRAAVFSVAFLTFMFALVTLLMSNAYNTTVGSFVSGETDLSIFYTGEFAMFKSAEDYNAWLGADTLTFKDGLTNGGSILGGGYNLATAFGMTGLLDAAMVLSFVSIGSFMILLIGKKQTFFSFTMLFVTTVLLIVLIVISSMLIADLGDNLTQFNTFGAGLLVDNGGVKSLSPTGLEAMKAFLETL